MTRISPPIVAILMLVISGCGSSPPVHYYVLDTMDLDYAQDHEGAPVMAVGPFRMPEYLNRSQMVTRGSGAEVIVDDTRRWAEPLNDSIHRIIASNVDALLGTVIVASYPSTSLVPVDYRVVGRIGRFDSDQNGLVVLEVQWGAGDTEGNLLVVPRRSRYESQAADPGNPGAIAQSMSDVLGQFSREIASESIATIDGQAGED